MTKITCYHFTQSVLSSKFSRGEKCNQGKALADYKVSPHKQQQGCDMGGV